jgi:Fur family ferric uptake transcriptional regulator
LHKEIDILKDYIRDKRLRYTPQREQVLSVFLSVERHVSAEELYKLVKSRYPEIGYATVYRTMKLLVQADLCEETEFGDGISRYEHKYGHSHHDHLICLKCGSYEEVLDPGIEALQQDLAEKRGFTPLRHRMQIFGVCRRCGRSK